MSAERVDQPVPDNQGIPGRTLAAQREAMGWTVEQVADQLKLAVRQVQAIEQGDYASLPPPAVVRGFVRAYAKVVKLDAAPLVAQIALDSPAPDMSPSVTRRDKPASFSQTRYPSNGKRGSKLPLGLIAGVVLVIAAAAAGAWQFGLVPGTLFGGSTSGTASSATTPADSAVTVLPQPVQGPGAPAATDAKPADAHPPVINNAVPLISVPPVTAPGAASVSANAPAGVAAATTPAGAAAAAPGAAPNALILSVREDSWIEVRPIKKGPPLFSRMVKGGTIETVTLSEPATLIVGKPSAVDATLRGAAVTLPAASRGHMARVKLQ